MAIRYDRGQLRRPHKTSQGFLRVDGYASRVGIFEYLRKDGTVRRELRLPEEVFRADSLESYEGAAMTNDHPSGKVTPANARRVAVGSVTTPAHREGEMVAISALVTDEQAIKDVERGKRELSSGYHLDIEVKSGTHPQWGKYDVIQRNIDVNHVAIVEKGRAGPEARFKMDAAEDGDDDIAIMRFDEEDDNLDATTASLMGIPARVFVEAQSQELSMEELKQKLAAALAQVAELQVRADQADKKVKELEGQVASQTARADKAEGERDAKETELVQARKDSGDDAITARVNARVDLVSKAVAVLGKEEKLDGLSDREIQVKVIKKVTGQDVPKEKADAYVQGQFDAAAARTDGARRAEGQVRQATKPTPSQYTSYREAVAASGGSMNFDVNDPEQVARAKMVSRNRTLWQNPLPQPDPNKKEA